MTLFNLFITYIFVLFQPVEHVKKLLFLTFWSHHLHTFLLYFNIPLFIFTISIVSLKTKLKNHFVKKNFLFPLRSMKYLCEAFSCLYSDHSFYLFRHLGVFQLSQFKIEYCLYNNSHFIFKWTVYFFQILTISVVYVVR